MAQSEHRAQVVVVPAQASVRWFRGSAGCTLTEHNPIEPCISLLRASSSDFSQLFVFSHYLVVERFNVLPTFWGFFLRFFWVWNAKSDFMLLKCY